MFIVAEEIALTFSVDGRITLIFIVDRNLTSKMPISGGGDK